MSGGFTLTSPCPICSVGVSVPVEYDAASGLPTFDVQTAIEAHIAASHPDPTGGTP